MTVHWIAKLKCEYWKFKLLIKLNGMELKEWWMKCWWRHILILWWCWSPLLLDIVELKWRLCEKWITDMLSSKLSPTIFISKFWIWWEQGNNDWWQCYNKSHLQCSPKENEEKTFKRGCTCHSKQLALAFTIEINGIEGKIGWWNVTSLISIVIVSQNITGW